MNVLSLFDGMACGMLAMQCAGIKVDRYVAYEIDKYAVQTSSHNFPMIEHRGDVFQADFTEFSGFDFLVGGSPCTYWSIAQTKNRETVASGMGWELFSQYVRALHEAQPMYFIYENNKSMANAIRESITQTFGFEPICINSALVSAQNRQRLYWVGKRNPDGTYSKVSVDQPEDRGITLADVLDAIALRDKANCLCGNRGGTSLAHDLVKQKHNYAAEPVRVGTYPNNAKNQAHDSQQYRIYSSEGKGVTLCGNGGGMGAKTGLYAVPVVEDNVLSDEYYHGGFDGNLIGMVETPMTGRNGKQPSQHCRVYSCDDKSMCLGTDSRNRIMAPYDGKTTPVYEVQSGQITIKGKQYPIKLKDGFYIIRKLTVSECKRLQTVPEWYEFPVSNAQAYKMLGNGWTVEVIAHLITATQTEQPEESQMNLFALLN